MDSSNTNLFELQIDASSQMYLKETAKWAKFLAILGFIFCGFIVIIGIFASSIFAAMGSRLAGAEGSLPATMGKAMAFFYICIALLAFFPYLFLLRFSNHMLAALRSNDQQQLTSSFRNLKSCYKYVGIFTIIILAIYVLIFLFVGLGALIGGSR
jgi:uncharacterized membrane protein YjgN (DUF898 family)